MKLTQFRDSFYFRHWNFQELVLFPLCEEILLELENYVQPVEGIRDSIKETGNEKKLQNYNLNSFTGTSNQGVPLLQ